MHKHGEWLAGPCLAGPCLASLCLLMALLGSDATALADEPKTIDCGETDLAFSASGYKVTCTDLSENGLNVGDTYAAARVAKLVAESNAAGTFLMVMDIRMLGNIFLKRSSLSADVEKFFGGGVFKDWIPDSTRSDFEVESFTGESDSGEVLNCIGFRREGARRYSGIGRLVIGLACTYNDRERLFDALKQLTAPGG